MHKPMLLLTVLVLILAACNGTSAPRKTVGDVERGATLFARGTDKAPACSTCHTTTETTGRRGFHGGPSLAGVSAKLEKRGLDTPLETYIEQSIKQPDAYIVSGYSNMMFPAYGEVLSRQQMADLVAYLITLDGAA